MMIYVKLLMTSFLWGGTFVAGRMLSDGVMPCSAAFLRFFIAAALLLILTWKVEGRLPKLKSHQIFPVLLLGLSGVFAYNILFFKGLKLIHAGRASLIIACNPIFITLFSALLFKERLTRIRTFGVLLSVTGAVVVITRGDPGSIFHGGMGWGEIFIFGCVASWVTFSLIGKTVLSGLSPLVSITYSSLAGAAALLPAALQEGLMTHISVYTLPDWISLSYLGVFGTVCGFIWYYQGIQTIGPSRAGLFINFVPISAIVLAFLILHEPVTFSLLAGAILVSSGVYLTNNGGLKPAKAG